MVKYYLKEDKLEFLTLYGFLVPGLTVLRI